MKEETIKKALEVSLSAAEGSLRTSLSGLEQRKEMMSQRILHTKELISGIRIALQSSIQRSRALAPEEVGKFLEKEIMTLDQAIATQMQQTADEIKRLSGAIEAFEVSIGQMSNVRSNFETELLRAQEIQDLQAAGELGKRRKPGTRPIKIKDIRNYVDPDLNKEPPDVDDVSKDS